MLKANRGTFHKNAVQWPLNRKRIERNAWAPYSGNTNWRIGALARTQAGGVGTSYLIHLVAEIDRVDVVALEVREHNYLVRGQHW